MNYERCTSCGFVNLPGAGNCVRCGLSLGIDGESAERTDGDTYAEGVPRETDLGKKVLFWFRIYSGLMVLLCLPVIGLGVILISLAGTFESQDPQGDIAAGLIFGIGGAALAVFYGFGAFLRRSPSGWFIGKILILFGLPVCFLLPATIPLLMAWSKPDSRVYFGRYSL
ncbi:MAG: hypothetical protein IPM63_14465 [Acidobacteriota bacterium]|nr:MAG: hypothetical protein IPM63_14465 [Acidobacteriota bacterium]